MLEISPLEANDQRTSPLSTFSFMMEKASAKTICDKEPALLKVSSSALPETFSTKRACPKEINTMQQGFDSGRRTNHSCGRNLEPKTTWDNDRSAEIWTGELHHRKSGGLKWREVGQEPR